MASEQWVVTSRTDELGSVILSTPAGTGAALLGVPATSRVVGPEMALSGADGGSGGGSGAGDAGGGFDGEVMREPLRAEGYEVRCPHCHALQFLARAPWECVAIDEATVAIKCWRRTCKRVLGLRLVSSAKCQVSSARGCKQPGHVPGEVEA